MLPIQRALGVLWCVESDQFQFRITLNTKPLTRRGVLSVVSSVYDPFGFVAPFVLSAKKILQDLCREDKLDWDDEMPDQYRIRWTKWIKELPEIENLVVDRCLKPSHFGQIVSKQMHLFSDASSLGYGAVAHLRLKDEHGNALFILTWEISIIARQDQDDTASGTCRSDIVSTNRQHVIEGAW